MILNNAGVDKRTRTILLVARAMMASLALFGGIEKIVAHSDAVAFATGFDIPYARLLMPFAILVEVGGAIGIMIPRYCRVAALVLAIWTFVLGIWFHRFWAVPASEWQMMIDSFFHHFVMTGGYLYVAVLGADGRATALRKR